MGDLKKKQIKLISVFLLQESEIHEVNTTLLANHDYNNSSDED